MRRRLREVRGQVQLRLSPRGQVGVAGGLVVALATGFVMLQPSAAPAGAPAGETHVDPWADVSYIPTTPGPRPGTVKKLLAASAGVAVFEVRDIRTGTPLKEPGKDGVTFPAQEIVLELSESLDGKLPRQIRLDRVGTDVTGTEGDPPYKVGERYLMFLRGPIQWNGKTFHMPTSMDSRFLLDGDKLHAAAGHHGDGNGVVEALDGQSLDHARTLVGEAR